MLHLRMDLEKISERKIYLKWLGKLHICTTEYVDNKIEA